MNLELDPVYHSPGVNLREGVGVVFGSSAREVTAATRKAN